MSLPGTNIPKLSFYIVIRYETKNNNNNENIYN